MARQKHWKMIGTEKLGTCSCSRPWVIQMVKMTMLVIHGNIMIHGWSGPNKCSARSKGRALRLELNPEQLGGSPDPELDPGPWLELLRGPPGPWRRCTAALRGA